MPYVQKPIVRGQIGISVLDDAIAPNSIVRVIDCFVDHLDLKEMEFRYAEASRAGRPCYDPGSMLKLYLYGYRKGIRSSRKLAEACAINIEVIWLLGGLRPDFRTIAEFRKNNIDCLGKVFKAFVRRVTAGMDISSVSIDGSKFKAWNNKERNFTAAKLDDRIERLNAHVEEYLQQLEETDKKEEREQEEIEIEEDRKLTKEEVEERLAEAKARLERYQGFKKIMEDENLNQISLTDADARLMKSKNGMDVSYNVQTAVEETTHLITGYLATNQPTDHGQMAPTIAEAEGDVREATADKGFEQSEDMVACLMEGIIPHVIPPEGKETYELEMPYVAVDTCDPASREKEEIARCLQAGIVPQVCEGIIEEMEVRQVKERVYDEKEEVKSPYESVEKMKNRASEGYYVRDPKADVVYCPGGEKLHRKSIKKDGSVRYANKQACRRCPYHDQCVTGKGKERYKELDFSKKCLEKEAKWWPEKEERKEEGEEKKEKEQERKQEKEKRTRKKKKYHYEERKVVHFKLRPNREKLAKRKMLSEHPFGTIKRTLGGGYFLLKGKEKISGEFALMATGYNLARAENLRPFAELMELMMG